MYKLSFQDIGIKDYKETWDFQEQMFQQVLEAKVNRQKTVGQIPGYLIFVEHPHVYTLGKSGAESNLLIQENFLKSIGASYYKINRGGDITYHGPGQVVGYPILDLEQLKLGVKEYVHCLEDVIIQTLKDYGISSSRMDGATGVWLDSNTNRARKICAIGVRISRYVTMHGFAFNVNTDLGYFNYINPCGFQDKGVTSLQKELNRPVDFTEIKNKLKAKFASVFSIEWLAS